MKKLKPFCVTKAAWHIIYIWITQGHPHYNCDRCEAAFGNLIAAYEDYVRVLGKELNELVRLAARHGWESFRVIEGEAARERIRILKEKLADGLRNL